MASNDIEALVRVLALSFSGSREEAEKIVEWAYNRGQKKKDDQPSGTSTIEERQKRFYNSLIPFLNRYPKPMLREFYDYWSEPDRSAKPKMRFEKEKTWSLERRLERWLRNNEDRFKPREQQSKPSKLDQYREVAMQLGLINGADESNTVDEQ